MANILLVRLSEAEVRNLAELKGAYDDFSRRMQDARRAFEEYRDEVAREHQPKSRYLRENSYTFDQSGGFIAYGNSGGEWFQMRALERKGAEQKAEQKETKDDSKD